MLRWSPLLSAAVLAAVAIVPVRAAESLRLRPPAVPLVVHNPYFSIWSAADRLTDVATTHWTGKPQPLGCLLYVDGKARRVMGAAPADVPALPQTGVEVLPTRTICRFAGPQVKLTLTFLTPALPENLEVLARPLTYLVWDIASADGSAHSVQLAFSCSRRIAVNTPEQPTGVDRPQVAGLQVLRVGSQDQPVLAKKGDDLRIDWGYCYLAAPADQNPQTEAGDEAVTLRFDLGSVGKETVSRRAMIAYDEQYAVNYFSVKLRPYWRRKGAEAADLLQCADRDYATLATRAAQFDGRLMADLALLGGQRYALLCALAYRQTLGGNVIAADARGMPLVFPKENFSNGCIATVDVLFPQSPFYLVFSPGLAKAMLVPVLDYAASPLWPYPYAPHDLGTYPWATGQVYGMRGGDGGRMPVEESGNMLIMLAALAKIDGDQDFVRKYWPMLTRWADYLVANGLDPQNQLCSADMFGHLPHCANLAMKAIIALGAYAQLCESLGKPDDAKRYRAIARKYTERCLAMARDEGRTRLAYHLAGTWGMKHNLVWDRVLGLGLFPPGVGDAEIAWYLNVQKPYGLPVDNRTDTSLIDWAMWSIALARDAGDFQTLLEPLFRYAHETPSRVPLSDWFVATDGRQRGFQARPVVGGIFVKMLADPVVWTRWAGKGTKVRGPWSDLQLPPPRREIAPTARRSPVSWRFTLQDPGKGWTEPAFDDSSWAQGPAGFGTEHTPGAVVRTTWSGKEIWLRRHFTLGSERLEAPQLLAHWDENGEVFLNGKLAATLPGWTTEYQSLEIRPEALAALRPGKNLLAVHCRQTTGGQYIDVGITDVEPRKATRAGDQKVRNERE